MALTDSMHRFPPLTFHTAVALLALAPFGVAQAQPAAQDPPGLQQHYTAAQRLQQAGRNDDAAREYRIFLASAQEELAAEYLASSDFARAGKLAQSVLSDPPQDSRLRANAHQILGRALLKKFDDRGARAEFEKADNLDPSFANQYNLAIACLDLDDDACATRIFTDLERSYGDSPALHMRLGIAYGNSDFTPKAVAEFRKVIAEDPHFPGAYYCLAAALLSAGDGQKNTAEAESDLKKELEITPRDPLSYAALGKLAVSAHRFSEAEQYLKRATSLDPHNPDAYLYLGQLYVNAGRVQDAEAALRKSIELTKDPSRNRFQIQKTHFLLGRVLMQEHRPQEAHREMELARTFAQQDRSRDQGQLAGLLNSSAASRTGTDAAGPAASSSAPPPQRAALRAFEQRLTPAIADSYNNLGVIAATAGHYPEALTDFNLAAEWNPTLGGLDLNRGRAAFMASHFSEAIAPLSRYIRAHPGDSGVRGALAMSLFMTHDYKDCLQTLHGIAGQLDSIPQMAYIFAESLVQTGQISQGMSRLHTLEAAHPEIPDVHRALGEALASHHDLQQAAQELQTALRLNDADAQAHYDLGKLQLETGDSAAAIPQLEAAVRLSPNDPVFSRELALAHGSAPGRQELPSQGPDGTNAHASPGAAGGAASPNGSRNPR